MDPDMGSTHKVSCLADVYAFGIILLQLITGLVNVQKVHKLLNRCRLDNQPVSRDLEVFQKHLDQNAGEWSLGHETLIRLAMKCAERHRQHRPNLEKHILPAILNILKAADTGQWVPPNVEEMGFQQQDVPPTIQETFENPEPEDKGDSSSGSDDDDMQFRIVCRQLKEAGDKMMKRKKFQKAYEKYGKALALLPNGHADKHELLCACAGSLSLSEGESASERVLSLYDEALLLSPGYAPALLGRTKVQLARAGGPDSDSWQAAQEDLEAVLQCDPGNEEAQKLQKEASGGRQTHSHGKPTDPQTSAGDPSPRSTPLWTYNKLSAKRPSDPKVAEAVKQSLKQYSIIFTSSSHSKVFCPVLDLLETGSADQVRQLAAALRARTESDKKYCDRLSSAAAIPLLSLLNSPDPPTVECARVIVEGMCWMAESSDGIGAQPSHPSLILRVQNKTGVPELSLEQLRKLNKDNSVSRFWCWLGKMEGGRVKKVRVLVEVLDTPRERSEVPTSRFLEGIQNMYRHQHPNVVSLVAFCCDGGTRAVVTEYPHVVTLSMKLLGVGIPLTWRQRMRIAVGVACGLDHLHNGAGPAKYHGHLSSWSVSLTENLEAQIAYDYRNLTAIKAELNEKKDVFDFGFFILCRVITGRLDLRGSLKVDFDVEVELLSQMVDLNNKGTVPPEGLKEVISLAQHCTLPLESDRCTIRHAKEKLINCLRMDETPETAV